MKLHEVPRRSKIKVLSNEYIPPGAPLIEEGDILNFDRLDGMYSVCYKDGRIVHLSVLAEVEVIGAS